MTSTKTTSARLNPLHLLTVAALSGLTALPAVAGTTQSWESLPKAVQAAVLANGGKPGSVDKESETKDGKAIYEASVKGADGVVKDVVISEDGKLIETKTDDAADAKAEKAAASAKKPSKRLAAILKSAKFSHPTQINNPYLPLSNLKQDILEGTEAGKKLHIERTLKPEIHKTFKFGPQTIESLAYEDRETENGELAEVTLDYFAQDDAGAVYYLGEEVDEYEGGKIVGHKGAWMLGKDTDTPGVILPAELKVGAKFRSEDVSAEIKEKDSIVSMSETVKVPAGTYANCIKVQELAAGEKPEFKYFAKGVGVVREQPEGGNLLLISHTTK